MVIKIGDRTIGGPGSREARVNELAATLYSVGACDRAGMTHEERINWCYEIAIDRVDRAIKKEAETCEQTTRRSSSGTTAPVTDAADSLAAS